MTAENQRYRHASDFGEVISPGYAISTMQDAIRTAKFLRALVSEIRKAQARRPGERIHILYPGPGPNAPFCLLSTVFFRPDEIGFTLIGYMQESFDACRRMLTAFGCEDYLIDCMHGDAVLYKHAGPPAQIAIAEIMQQALRGEPQFSIFKNLAPQLSDDGVLIPARIELRAGLSDPQREYAPENRQSPQLKAEAMALRSDLGPILELSKATLLERYQLEPKRYERTQDWDVPDFKIPPLLTAARTFTIFTKIYLNDEIELLEGESGLTMPVIEHHIPNVQPGDEIHCTFRLGARPGLVTEHHRPRMRILKS